MDGIEIVGEAVDVEDAVQKIADLRPGLLFLDVQMPGADGFSLLERLELSRRGSCAAMRAWPHWRRRDCSARETTHGSLA